MQAIAPFVAGLGLFFFPEKAQDAAFATMRFERIIWLARRNTLLLTPDPAQTHLATGAAA
jgi:hypothetical protein